MIRIFTWWCCLLMASGPSWAQSFLLTGDLDDGTAPADGLFTFDLAIEDVADPPRVRWRESQPNVVVVDGAFAVEVGANEPLAGAFDARSVLRVTIDGDVLEPLPLATLVRVARAAVAEVAETAPTASRLGSLTADQAVRRSALATPGGARIPWTAVTVPIGVADGDDATEVVAAGQGLSFSDRHLRVVAVSGDRFQAGAVSGSAFLDGSIDESRVADGAVTGATVSSSSLRRADLVEDVGERQVNGTPVYQVTAAGCIETGLSARATCGARTCAGGFMRCDNRSCDEGNPATCPNEYLGLLVAP
jgi:hypothetical protein